MTTDTASLPDRTPSKTAVLVSLAIALESIWPGLSSSFDILALFVGLAVGLVLAVRTVIWGVLWLRGKSVGPSRVTIVAVVLLLGGADSGAFRTAAFQMSKGALNELADSLVANEEFEPGWYGIYHVDTARADENGSAFLRTAGYCLPIFGDTISYGFMRGQPIDDVIWGPTTPFGARELALTPLTDGWSVFYVNSDW